MRRNIFLAFFLLLAGVLFAAGTEGGGGSGSSSGAKARPSPVPTALDIYNEGYALSNAGRYQEAAADFQKAIDMKSDYAEAYNMLGYCTRKMGNVAGAFAFYDKALQLKPNFPEAREYYGEAYLQEGNLAKAVQQYIILEKARSRNAQELLDKIDQFVSQKS
jgi:tetratricopeptide (TPR) repeat protein